MRLVKLRQQLREAGLQAADSDRPEQARLAKRKLLEINQKIREMRAR